MMRFIYFAFALALLPLSATAQDKKDEAPQSSTSVLINGQPIKGKVLEIDGKHFVAVEDIAQSLRGTIGYGDGQIALTLSQLPPTAAPPPSSEVPLRLRPRSHLKPYGLEVLSHISSTSILGTSPTLGAKYGLLKVVLKSQPTKILLVPAPR